MPATFATELEALVRKHLGTPQWADDYQLVCDVLAEASARIPMEAERFRWRDESEREFERRLKWQIAACTFS